MAKIIWSKHWDTFTKSLQRGLSVRETADIIGVSYNTFCKYLREISIDREGHFKKPIKNTPELEEYFAGYVMKHYNQLQEICKDFAASSSQIQNLMRTYNIKKEWDLKNSTSENVAIGRKGELFIKEMEDFKVVADKIKTDSKSPYDLILRGYGGVDVKVTKMRGTNSGGHRHKFNIANLSKPTKYAFLLGYDEEYENPMILLIIPFKVLKGKKSISVSVEKLYEGPWGDYVYKIFNSPEKGLYPEKSESELLEG